MKIVPRNKKHSTNPHSMNVLTNPEATFTLQLIAEITFVKCKGNKDISCYAAISTYFSKPVAASCTNSIQ